MLEWMLMPLRRYAEFSGRSRRREYWSFMLLNVMVSAVLIGPIYGALISNLMTTASVEPGSFDAAATAGFQWSDHPIAAGMGVLGVLWSLFTFVPGIAVTVRRLHDRDMSGWWYLGMVVASMIPLIGFIVALGFLVVMFLEGTKGPNRFGADPKSAQNAHEVFG